MSWSEKEASTIREMIVHESNVTDHRLQWLMTLEGLLFTALGFVWKDRTDLVGVLAAVGIATAVSAFIALFAANKACRDLCKAWDQNKLKDYNGPPVIGHAPTAWWHSFIHPWFLIPGVLVVTWLYLVFMI